MECPECKISFGSEGDLQQHVLRFHKKDNVSTIQYQCVACKQKWTNYRTLLKHQLTCGQQPGPSGAKAGSSKEPEDDSGSADFGTDGPSFPVAPVDTVNWDVPETNLLNKSYEECVVSLEEQLQDEVVQLLRDLKDSNATQSTINQVIVSVDKIKRMVLSVCGKLLKEKAGDSEVLTVSEAVETIEDLKCISVFDTLQQPDEFINYLEKFEGLIKPVKVVLEQQQEIQNQKVVITDKSFFYQVPFLPQLEQLLQCPDVLKCVDNPREPGEFTYVTITNGIGYLHHPVYLKHKNSSQSPPLCVLLYHDGVDPSDTASSRSGLNNMVLFYWTLGNIYPEFRCSRSAIQLYAIVKNSDLKKYGYTPIMENIITSMNVLSKKGVTFDLKTEKRLFHGFLECSLGDYPAQGAIGGFKMAVTAKKPCRECYVSNDDEEDFITIYDYTQFQLRNLEMHETHLKELVAYSDLSSKEQSLTEDPSVLYGVREKSVLLDLKHFNVTKNMPQDLMHTANEGILAHMCHLLLRHVIVEEKKLNVTDVNNRIAVLSKAFPSDRPGKLKEEHLAPKGSLRQSSAQMRVLSLILPFALQVRVEDGSQQFAGDQKYLSCFLKFTQILNFCLAYKFYISDVDRLKKRISEFHKEILSIDPTINMAKLHFLHHLPDQIVIYGGIRQVACYRFEGHHAFFKRLFKILHNYVNPMKTLALHHQIRKCNQMKKENFLYSGHEYTTKIEVTDVVDRHVSLVKESFPTSEKIYEVSTVKIFGTTYKEGSVVMFNENGPDFGIVRKMYHIGTNEFCFVCSKAKIRELDNSVNAYKISTVSTLLAIDVLKLVYPHPVVKIVWNGNTYAMPLGHRILLVGDD